MEGGRIEDSKHLFILVHGLGSSYIDMISLMFEISIATPNAEFILPESISRAKTHSRIQKLAKDIADEISEKIEEEVDINSITKITFICHSLGGVIIRAALPYLLEFKDKFYSFLTMGSPHLGVLNSESHIKFGTWVSEIYYDSSSVNQLRLADADKVEHTFMYQLSQKEGLEYFEHVYFIASPQDLFVPYYSARVQIFKDDLKESNAKEHYSMNENILNKCTNGVTRVDVYFNIKDKDFSALIGGKAHILFLNYQPFLNVLVNRYRSTIFSQ